MKRQDLDYWQSVEQQFAKLYPNGMTQEQIDDANQEMWRNAYPTLEMAVEDEQEPQTKQDHLYP